MAEGTEIKMADGTLLQIRNAAGKSIWTMGKTETKITRLRIFDTDGEEPLLVEMGGNWMTGTHFISVNRDPDTWCRALELPGSGWKGLGIHPKGLVYSVELNIDLHITLKGDILVATFGKEPHRQGYTKNVKFRLGTALRIRGLMKVQIIE